jgi:uncharacterized protein YxjI
MTQNKQAEKGNENRDEHNPGQIGGKRYTMRQKMISIGNDYWIENEQGERVFQVDGKAMRLHKTFYFEDAHGKKLAKIVKARLKIKETMQVNGLDGEQLALVKKDVFTPLKEHFVAHVKDGPDLDIHGNLLDHEYAINQGEKIVAQVSKKWLNLRDSYSISIDPGQDDVIILSVVLCIDEMTH